MDVLARRSRFQHIKNGQILFFQSDPSEFAYIVRSGEISIVLNSPDGRAMMINKMRPRDIFDELGILTARPRSTGAIACADTEILAMPVEAFRRILKITAERLQRSGERG